MLQSSIFAPVPPAIQRVRCRPIVEADLDRLADLLARGFPRSRRNYWTAGFARWQSLQVVEGVPRYGYVLEGEIGLVGVILLISSQRGARIISNLSSWYVDPLWRANSAMLISVATKLRHVIYLNASPAPHTWRTLQMQGFKPYNFGRSAVFAWPGKGHVSQDIPEDLAEARLLSDHRAMGALSLTVEVGGIVSPFVFKPRRLDRPPVKVMDLIFCRDIADFGRCLPALAKHFLKQGVLGFLIDGRIDGIRSHYVEGKEPRYYKGPQAPALGDLAYTEKTVFG
jgi:hypothetical protein